MPKKRKRKKNTTKNTQKMIVNTLLVKHPQIISSNQYLSRKNRFNSLSNSIDSLTEVIELGNVFQSRGLFIFNGL